MLNFNHFLDCITHPNNTVAAEDEYDDAYHEYLIFVAVW